MSIKIFCMHTCTFLLLCCGIMAEERTPRKRQIYREQVLPHAGGRIPDTAFETDRLFLNRLQKDGIAIPDGIVPEQRSPQVYQYYHKSPRMVYRIALSSDGRYTAKEGKYSQRSFEDVPSVETTYLYPQIHGQNVVLTPPSAVFPVYRQFQLHNAQLNQVKFQPKKKPASPAAPVNSNGLSTSSYQIIGGSSNHINHNNQQSKTRSKGAHRTESYQNFNLLNVPLNPVVRNTFKPSTRTGKNYYLPNYNTAQLFNDFDEIFNKFDIDESTALRY